MAKTNNDANMAIAQNCMNKSAETVTGKALDLVISFIKREYGRACVDIGSAFESYLYNSVMRYNKVKTLADLSEPRELEGKNGIYVDVFVMHKENKVSAATIENLINNISNNIVILGSGGTGKSMIMRHLFVNTSRKERFIPVLVELRKIKSVDGKNDLLDLIHYCMESFDVKLDKEQFEYSLKSGRYLFLFDGLDEVKEELRRGTSQLIQELTKKYPLNCYIVSSRNEGVEFSELETYTLVQACPLKKSQAVELVKKIGRNDEKVIGFSKLLEDELYDKHKDFASNPLLLTMMYITFIDNNMIPEQLTDFYESAYDALYKRHDANKEGLFKREYKCQKLGEREFKDLFSYFCFQSYFSQQYEFSAEEICEYIKKGITRLSLNELVMDPKMFFDDIKDIVCLIVDEGNKYKFAHRSFQTYFAAHYTAVHVTDEQQKAFLKKAMIKYDMGCRDYFNMLYRLEGERFNINVVEPGVECILEKLDNEPDIRFGFLKICCQAISLHDNQIYRGINSSKNMDIPYERNVILLFEDIFIKDTFYSADLGLKIIALTKEIENRELVYTEYADEIETEDLIKIQPESVQNELLELVYVCLGIDYKLKYIQDWYKNQQEKRKELEENKAEDEMFLLL